MNRILPLALLSGLAAGSIYATTLDDIKQRGELR